MANYNDFRNFIKDGAKNRQITEKAVHHGRFNDFLKLTTYTNETVFFNNVVSITDLQSLLLNIHNTNAKGLKDFLEIQNGFGNTWLKYFILWYLCNQHTQYPSSMPPLGSLPKKNLGVSIQPLLNYISELQRLVSTNSVYQPLDVSQPLTVSQPIPKEWLDLPRQIILWGVPGTGKSYTIDEKISAVNAKISAATGSQIDNVFRVTFHPAMDYASFVGCYKPVMEGKTIAYRFQPQAFLNAYKKACEDPAVPVFLIIEEINRGNCAQIFGDTFQLLDRDDMGVSKYPITPHEDIKNWLESTQIADKDKIRIPSNMFIWATMNSSDQSLYKLDSAFQRRWKMMYTPINPNLNDVVIRIDSETTVSWVDFLIKVNAKIADVCEERRIGPFFVKSDADGEINAVDFVGKVVNYLYRAVFSIYNVVGNPSDSLGYDSFYNVDESVFGNDVINTDNLVKFFNLIGCKVMIDSSENHEFDDSVNNSEDEGDADE